MYINIHDKKSQDKIQSCIKYMHIYNTYIQGFGYLHFQEIIFNKEKSYVQIKNCEI